MLLTLRIYAFVSIAMFLANGSTINYHFHQENGQGVNDCMTEAIARIERETCLTFQENPHAHNAILFLDSNRCGFQDSNATVHVDSNCMTTDSCIQFLQHAITGDKQHHSVSIRHLNLKFNCTDKCTRECVGGSIVQAGCKCKCRYGFSGENCDRLKLEAQFTDASCGFIDAATSASSVISLKGQANKDTFCQWVLKLDNPFHSFHIEVEELDLDGENVPPGQTCGDSLYIYGLDERIENPIPCANEDFEENKSAISSGVPTSRDLVGTTLHSKSNIVLIEYRGNRLSSRSHKGPVFKYTVVRQQPFNNEFPSMKYEHVTAGATANFWNIISLITTLFILTVMMS